MLTATVQHRRFHEDQLLAVADIQRIAGYFHHLKIPFRMMVRR